MRIKEVWFMAEISSKIWIGVGLIVAIMAFIFNRWSNSLKFTLFLVAGIIMIIIGITGMMAEQKYNEEKKKMDTLAKQDELISQRQMASLNRQHKSRMEDMLHNQQQRVLAGQAPPTQGVRHCARCGSVLNSSDRFCFHCGAAQFR